MSGSIGVGRNIRKSSRSTRQISIRGNGNGNLLKVLIEIGGLCTVKVGAVFVEAVALRRT